MTTSSRPSQSLAQRLAQLERLLTEQQREIAQQREHIARQDVRLTQQDAEIERLRPAPADMPATPLDGPARPEASEASAATSARGRASRRALLKLGGAAAAASVAAVAAGATELAHPGTAHANGVVWQTGIVNADVQTVVEPANGSFPDPALLTVRVGTGGAYQPVTAQSGAAIATYDTTGVNTGVYATSAGGIGVWGVTSTHYGVYGASLNSGLGVVGTSNTGTGVFGRSSTATGVSGTSTSGTGVSGTSTSGYGVLGTSPLVGVYGISNASNTSSGVAGQSTDGYGVSGQSTTGPGVGGQSTSGYGVVGGSQTGSGVGGFSSSSYGVFGQSNTGPGVVGTSISGAGVSGFSHAYGGAFQGGSANLLLTPALAAGAPATGAHSAGELYVDSAGVLWYCISGNGTGVGIWMRLSGPQSGVSGGAVNYLSAPIRIFDSRAGQPAPLPTTKAQLAAGTTTTIQVTGTTVNSLSVPAGATGVIGNLTVTNAKGPGDLILWPTGAAQPLTSNINYVGSQTVANFASVALSSAGQMNLFVHVGDTDVIFDVVGYVL